MAGKIELKALTKRFGPAGEGGGGIVAVDGVTFTVEPGEVLGFLGPNGAGKSTTMKMVTGYLPPTSGTAVVCGHDILERPLEAKSKIGYLPEGAPAYPDMTPEGFLRFIADARGMRGEPRRRAIDAAVDAVMLQDVMRQPIETLSKGFKRRVGLAQAIVHDPEVLIMDEPTDGLDPNQKHEVRSLIKKMAGHGGEGAQGRGRAKAIVLSTHILEEVEAVCTRVVVIAKGRVVVDSSPAQFVAKSKYHNAVTVSVIAPAGVNAAEELRRVAGVKDVEDHGTKSTPDGSEVRCTLLSKGGRPIAPEVSHMIKAKGWQVSAMHVEHGRLDDVFRELTLGGPAQAGSGVSKQEGAA